LTALPLKDYSSLPGCSLLKIEKTSICADLRFL
jgi:hypothetical protein